MILLRDTRDHFAVQGFAQRLMWLHGLCGKFVFSGQISQNLRIGAVIVTQPVVIIDAVIAVCTQDLRAFFSLWRCHHLGISLSSLRCDKSDRFRQGNQETSMRGNNASAKG
ncbi:hypothetical protein D3C80_1404960 [compost metagenome]